MAEHGETCRAVGCKTWTENELGFCSPCMKCKVDECSSDRYVVNSKHRPRGRRAPYCFKHNSRFIRSRKDGRDIADDSQWPGKQHKGQWSPWYRTSLGYVKRSRRLKSGNGPGSTENQSQHRYVMEKFIGRKLLPTEEVHHKNNVKWDNRVENLEIWVKSQPAGARAIDVYNWAKEMVSKYEAEVESGVIS